MPRWYYLLKCGVFDSSSWRKDITRTDIGYKIPRHRYPLDSRQEPKQHAARKLLTPNNSFVPNTTCFLRRNLRSSNSGIGGMINQIRSIKHISDHSVTISHIFKNAHRALNDTSILEHDWFSSPDRSDSL